MAMNYTPIPNDFLEEMSELTDAEYGRLIRWCQTYITTGEQIELRGNEKYHLVRCRMQMDRYTSHYAEVSRKRSAAGKKGGEANASKCKQTEASGGKRKETKTKTKTKTNNSPTNVGRVSSAHRFIPPTLEEVSAYVAERGSNVDPQGFIDFYAAKGWMIGKTPMKDWKAACRNAEKWERWGKSGPAQQPQGRATVPKDARKNAEWMRKILEADE